MPQTVSVGAAVQKMNHQSLFRRDHHFTNQDTDHQLIDLDVQFATGDIVQDGLGIRRNIFQSLLQQTSTVGHDTTMGFHQMAYSPVDGGVQFPGINMAAFAFFAPGFLLLHSQTVSPYVVEC